MTEIITTKGIKVQTDVSLPEVLGIIDNINKTGSKFLVVTDLARTHVAIAISQIVFIYEPNAIVQREDDEDEQDQF